VVPGAGPVGAGAWVVVPGAGVVVFDCAATRVTRPTRTASGEKERATGDIVGFLCVYILLVVE
jgi:hypothetical protein